MPTVGRVSIRLTVSWAARSPLNAPAIAEAVDDDGKDQDDPDGDGLEVRLHADEVHAIGEDSDKERAEDRPHDPPFTAPKRDAANHCGRDRFERELTSEIWFSGGGTGGKEQPRNSRQQAAHDINRGSVDPDRDAGEIGGFRIAADGIEIPSSGRRADQKEHQNRRDNRHVDGHRAFDPTPGADFPREERRHAADRRSARVVESEAGPDRRHAERHDERGDLEAGDADAVDESEDDADEETDTDPNQHRSQFTVRICRVVARHIASRDDARYRDDRAHGEIKAAANEYQRLSERNDDEIRRLAEHVRQIRGAVEATLLRSEVENDHG